MSESKVVDNGGPAFPGFQHTEGYGCSRKNENGDWEVYDTGMTLRDWFAGKALQGWLSTYGIEARHPVESNTQDSVCECAYAIADAMIRAKNKKV